jgi:hypothetical protein
MSMFPDKIQVQYSHVDQGVAWFITLAPFRFRSHLGLHTIPAGFLTDGASIPRVFHSLMGPFGSYFPAALAHDWLYTQASQQDLPTTRREADEIFQGGMHILGVPWLLRNTMHRAVRMFGWLSYLKR